MKISYNWLKEYVRVNLSPDEAAEILTSTGLEVEKVEKKGADAAKLQGLVVGEVKEVQKHPNAERLNLTKVDVGTGENLSIVCGAPNVAVGQKVIVATVGTTLYPTSGDKFTIKRAKIRGEESEGMICAEDEIGIGESHEGIMVLGDGFSAGTPAADVLATKEDFVFEIGLTPNRSDAMSHIGVARDLAAALNFRKGEQVQLQLPDVSAFATDDHSLDINVEVKDSSACPRYSGVTISGVKVGESPQWLKEKLESIGIRPINNIVDVTNFVLKELGQPLHAFDAAAIAGQKVVVQKLAAGAPFTTLDAKERKLHQEDLMICNAETGMCIAGVFGGASSGVTAKTTDIFLESAYFSPGSIRRTALRHDLRTDAAMRYEKGADPNITIYALKRAALLIKEVAGGKISSEIKDVYPNPIDDFRVKVRLQKIEKLLGVSLEEMQVKQILQLLDIRVLDNSDREFTVAVPPYRTDVTREADVAEEIARIFGFNRIPSSEQIRYTMPAPADDFKEQMVEKLSAYLSAHGFNEMFTNSISSSTYYEKTLPETSQQLVKLLNSVSKEMDVLRATMFFSGLEVIRHNTNYGNPNLRLYEFGKTYIKNGDQYNEQEELVLFVTGSFPSGRLADEKDADFHLLNGYVRNIFVKAGVKGAKLQENTPAGMSSGIIYVDGNDVLAEVGIINPEITKPFDLKNMVFFAKIPVKNLLRSSTSNQTRFKEIPKFPGMKRDLSLLLDKKTRFAEIENIAREEGGKLLKDVQLFDIYKDEKMEQHQHSYAVSFFFRDDTKTLTDKDVDQVMERLMKRLQKDINASIR